MGPASRCAKCKLKEFCTGDKKQNFYDEMWGRYEKFLSKEFAENMKDHLQRKAKNRKNTDKSDYLPRCYYAVLLYHAIEDQCLDHYNRWKIDWASAGESEKKHEAPAIDHIDPKCKAPFKKDGNLNLAFCRNDVNDAKNDLPKDRFVELCRAVVSFADKKSSSSPFGV